MKKLFILVVFCAFFPVLFSAEVGSVFVTRIDPRLKIDGVTQTKFGLLWKAGQHGQLTISTVDGKPLDLTPADVLVLKVYSNGGKKGQLMATFFADPSTRNYRFRKLYIGNDDWQIFRLPLSTFARNGKDFKFDSVVQFRLTSNGWGMKPDPDWSLLIQEISLDKVVNSLPKTAGKAPWWPTGVRISDRDKAVKDPLWQKKLAEIEKMRRAYEIKISDYQRQLGKNNGLRYWENIDPETGCLNNFDPKAELDKLKNDPGKYNAASENLCLKAAGYIDAVLYAWQAGFIKDTPENRRLMRKVTDFYFTYEFERGGNRWVASAFSMPNAAVMAYFTFIDDMEAVESGANKDAELVKFNLQLKRMASQVFTHPEHTIPAPPMTVDSFRTQINWVNGNFGYRHLIDVALVCRNPEMIDIFTEVSHRAFEGVSHHTRNSAFWYEGLTVDGAAWGHGSQNYIFGYPAHGYLAIGRGLCRLRGTPWERALSPENLRNAIDFVRGGLWYSFGKCGPTLLVPGRVGMLYSGSNPYNDATSYVNFGKYLLQLIPENTPEYQELTNLLDIADGKAPEFTGCRYFWNQDDLIWRKPDFYCGINMTSSRVLSNEIVQSSSRYTEFFSAGAAFLMRKTDTYLTARGFFKPYAVPGVTARQCEYPRPGNPWFSWTGKHNFAGGVANGNTGCAGFIFEIAPVNRVTNPAYEGIYARKAYFGFEDGLIFLGSAIIDRKNTGETVATSVDQTEWTAPVEIVSEGKKLVYQPGEKFSFTTDKGAEICHDGVGYWIPAGEKLTVTGETRQERWVEFDPRNSRRTSRPEKCDILFISISQGENPVAGTYCYGVFPGVENAGMIAEKNNLRIVSCSPEILAVEDTAAQIVQAVIFSPRASWQAFGRKWSCNAPAVLAMKKVDGKISVTAADPLQKNPRRITLTSSSGDKISLTFPADPYRGKAVSGELVFNK